MKSILRAARIFYQNILKLHKPHDNVASAGLMLPYSTAHLGYAAPLPPRAVHLADPPAEAVSSCTLTTGQGSQADWLDGRVKNEQKSSRDLVNKCRSEMVVLYSTDTQMVTTKGM